MPLLENLLIHGIIAAIILVLYLLPIMIKLSPRIWAFSDYPKSITDHVSPQTKHEKQIGATIFLPFIVIFLGIPIISTLMLEAEFGGTISLLDAFLNTFGIMMFLNFADLVILDTLIIGTITPDFAIIPGTEHMRDKEYKDFRLFHAKGHIGGTIGMAVLSLIIALVISYL
jgi:hypothetical protein